MSNNQLHSNNYSSMLNFNVEDANFYNQLFESNYNKATAGDLNDNCLALFGVPPSSEGMESTGFSIFPDTSPNDGTAAQQANSYHYENLNALSSSMSETLLLQDLNIPSGMDGLVGTNGSSQVANQPSYRRHSKKPSGAALFGFHGRELSIPGIKPIDIMSIPDSLQNREERQRKPHNVIDPKAITLSKDYIITNNKPSSYKFPPDPEPEKDLADSRQQTTTFFSAGYLSKMSRIAQQKPDVGGFNSYNGFGTANIAYPESIDEILEQTQSTPVNNLNENYALNNSSNALNNITETCFPSPQPTAHSSPIKGSINVHNLTLQVPSTLTSSKKTATPELKSQSSYQNVYMTPSPKYSTFNNPNNLLNTASSITSYSSPEDYNQPQTATPSSYHGSPVKIAGQDNLNWEDMTKGKNNTTCYDNSPGDSTFSYPLQKRKGLDKVSTLPPGYIDQFVVGPDHNKKYYCNYNNCGKVFQRRYNIRSHIQTHLCDRPYKCSYDNCTKSFVRQHDLHRHEKIHENNKFSCLCGKGFTRYDALRRHTERNICVGGIETEASINKPKKKRGRPKKIVDENNSKLNEKLEKTVESAVSNSNNPIRTSLDNFNQHQTQGNDLLDDMFAFEDNKENSFADTPSGKNSAPLTPISANGSKRALPLSARLF